MAFFEFGFFKFNYEAKVYDLSGNTLHLLSQTATDFGTMFSLEVGGREGGEGNVLGTI